MVAIIRTIQGLAIRFETHIQPHLDEIAALWLVERFATEDWLRAHFPDGVFQAGVGGGEFDEHAFEGQERKRDECCVTLVASALGVIDQPELQQILRFIYTADCGVVDPRTGIRSSRTTPFDLYATLKRICAKTDATIEQIIDWCFLALDAHYADQVDFQLGLRDLETAREVAVETPRGVEYVVCVTSTSSAAVRSAASKYKQGPKRLGVFVQHNPNTLQTIILRASGSQICLEDVACVLRLAERRQRKIVPIPSGEELRAEGVTCDVLEWYYNKHAQQLFNGSLTHPDTPKTRFPLEYVLRCVVVGIESYYARQGFRKSQAKAA